MIAFLRKYGVAFLSGSLLAWSFPGVGFHPFAWAALSLLFVRTASMRRADTVRQFAAAAHAFHSVLFYWMIANTYWAGGWAIFGQQLLCAYLDLYWCAFALAWVSLRDRLHPALLPAAGGVAWAALEHVESFLFSGFGWSALGYSQGPNLAVAQWAVIGGVNLVSLLLVAVNVCIALTVTRQGRARAGFAAATVLLLVTVQLGGRAMLAEADYASKPFKVGIFQSNFSLEMKWDQEYSIEMIRNAVSKSRLIADHHHTDLVVWPEALVMDPIDDPVVTGMIKELATGSRTAVFGGGHRAEHGPYRSYNSSFLMDANGVTTGIYDKIHLVPYGEYVPLADFLPFVTQVVPAIGNMVRGTEAKVLDVGGRRLGPLICFEVLYGPMAERLRTNGADFLTVITNLSWFGMSSAIPQELEIARMRAIETRLPLVHAANTGISGVFDPYGRFTLIDGAVDSEGDYRELIDGVTPEQTIRERLVGAFDLAAPAPRLFDRGPSWFPWINLAGAILLLAAAAALRSPGMSR